MSRPRRSTIQHIITTSLNSEIQHEPQQRRSNTTLINRPVAARPSLHERARSLPSLMIVSLREEEECSNFMRNNMNSMTMDMDPILPEDFLWDD
mmetsp:Transcript_1582/g.2163  ORF Transcript_1582/g.2163 Transcript_1582/m.2163 type:complete len:94 (-) Transcript_1582:224-505(-)